MVYCPSERVQLLDHLKPAAARVALHPLPALPRRLDDRMSTPWFPMYPTDFLVSTATLTPTQGWAYTQLLMYAWTNGSVPDDRAACCALTRCQLTEADWAVVRGRFAPMAGPMAGPMATLVNPRMERERARVVEKHATASENGKRGAEARWGRGNGVANGNANGGANGETMATTTTTTTTDNPPKAPPQAGERRRLRRRDVQEQLKDPNWVPF
ncbi:DUF1376 domain-containing protein [Gemmatimonas sp.]|uniref:DUF1376 domain-containing protein n=1 Tax=Gemmatimonas sp. TaxID=1962908 RepID=UPI00333EF210